MFRGTTTNGFEFEIKKDAFNDMRVIDALADMEDEDIFGLSRVATLLLGSKQKKALYKLVEKEDGSVPVSEVNSTISEIFVLYGEDGKNSESSQP